MIKLLVNFTTYFEYFPDFYLKKWCFGSNIKLMTTSISFKKYPGDFLSSLTNEIDKDYAIESKKMLAFRLYEASLDGLKRTSVHIGFGIKKGSKDGEEQLKIKTAVLDTLHIYGIVKSYKVVKQKDGSIYADTEFDPEEATYFYEHIGDFFPFGDASYEQFLKEPDSIKNVAKRETLETERPFCKEKDGIGYLQFGTNTGKIEIGVANTQPFKLLQCLTEPFGHPKSVDTVFEVLRENLYKKSKSGVYDSFIDKPKKLKIIEHTMKELQKGNKLKGKLKFKWDKVNTKLWLEYIT